MKNKGIWFACVTALVSGVSVFLNKFSGAAWRDSSVFTTVKNIPVALLFLAIVLSPKIFAGLKKLSKKQWLYLLLVGLIGGSIPFLLFFRGLAMTSAANAAFIQKTLFIWVGILAMIFLKEKFGVAQIAAFGLLFVGNFILGGIKSWKLGAGELMILGATLLWSIEYVLAKKLLANTSSETVGWARMFFGSIFMIIFLAATGRAAGLASVDLSQAKWLALSSGLLFVYVFTWYKALKYAPASVVTCLLVPASLLTTLLNSVFVTHRFSIEQAAAGVLFSAAITLIVKYKPQFKVYGSVAKTI
jgi:drug/metabolite transporter (DMT)-like permease